MPWRSYSTAPPPPPKPTPSDPCTWHVYSDGYNTSNIPGPKGNIACGSNLDSLLAQCCKNKDCASVSFLNGGGCLKPNDDGGWTEAAGALSYVVRSRPTTSTSLAVADAVDDASSTCPPAVIVRSAKTGLEVRNVIIVNATTNNEAGTIVFEPIYGPGEYHAYYLPHSSRDAASRGEFWTVETIYTPYNASAADVTWAHQALATIKSLPQADFIELEPRVEFHRSTDMELIATTAEVAALKANLPASQQRIVVFPEDRTNPLRLTNVTDLLPMRWAQNGPPNQTFSGSARRGEWYAFQLGVWAVAGPVQIQSAEFHSDSLPTSAFTCINLGGIDETGAVLTNTVYLAAGQLNSLWCGVQIPLDAKASSTVKATVTLSFGPSEKPADVAVSIQITPDEPLYDHGDADVWRMSRLRWLDSTIGSDNSEVPTPYLKINHTVSNDGAPLVVRILGRTVDVESTGLPASISAAKFGGRLANLLNAPMELRLVDSSTAPEEASRSDDRTGVQITESSNSKLSWSARSSQAGGCVLTVNGSLWFDGYGIYSMTVSAPAGKDISLEDVQLRLHLNESIAKFMMGFGRSGGAINGGFGGLPLNWKWGDGPYQIWAGNTDAGMRFKLTGPEVGWAAPSYSYSSTPPVWENGGKGGANITQGNETVEIVAFTGPISVNASRSITLYFEMLLTPVKPLNRGVDHPHWSQRHYQVGYGANGSAFATPAEVARTGATVANLHQGIGAGSVAWPGHTDIDEGLLNPFINYPFEPSSVQLMSDWVREAAELNVRTKFYYTVRELSNHCAELWALRSLGTEILAGGKHDNRGTQSGTSWLIEHLVDDYSHCWQNPLTNGEFDSAVCDTGVSRWTNFYIEGLNISTSGPPDIDGMCVPLSLSLSSAASAPSCPSSSSSNSSDLATSLPVTTMAFFSRGTLCYEFGVCSQLTRATRVS